MKENVIIFSGLDGCGKSTQISRLCRHLESKNIKYKMIWARPGSTPLFLLIKSFARFSFRSLPKGGRSNKREAMLRSNRIGRLWFYLTFLELIFIFKIKSNFFLLFGNKIIFDRYLLDSVIDYEIMLDKKIMQRWLIKYLLSSDKKLTKIFLNISIAESIHRCKIKWEPFPDTDEEKVKRFKLYNNYINNFGYIIMDGQNDPDIIWKNILNIVGK